MKIVLILFGSFILGCDTIQPISQKLAESRTAILAKNIIFLESCSREVERSPIELSFYITRKPNKGIFSGIERVGKIDFSKEFSVNGAHTEVEKKCILEKTSGLELPIKSLVDDEKIILTIDIQNRTIVHHDQYRKTSIEVKY